MVIPDIFFLIKKITDAYQSGVSIRKSPITQTAICITGGHMKPLSTALLTVLALQTATTAHAAQKPLFDFADKERWIIRARVLDIDPDEDSTVNGLAANVDADYGFTPELDFTYFFTDHVAARIDSGHQQARDGNRYRSGSGRCVGIAAAYQRAISFQS
jgi:hypothetical protein